MIGSVTLHKPKTLPADSYSDKAEDALLELFSGDNVEQKRSDILNSNPTWAMYYHLNKRRGNLLRWYEFKDGATVLEVGAGCGGVTEELVRHNVQVTALELMPKRATINALRNKFAKNLNVIVDNLEDYKPLKKFDYVVCVGVLEYAGKFIHSQSPYVDFMKKMASLLAPGGTVLLAIENRFGLKYWSGATEDHVHKYFEGHNGYPAGKGVQTFGKKELADMFLSTGFKTADFYYPFPDYKTPTLIYSDAYHPGNGAAFPLGALPTPSLDWHREELFSEQNAMRYIEANGLFPYFSNSFLVEGSV